MTNRRICSVAVANVVLTCALSLVLVNCLLNTISKSRINTSMTMRRIQILHRACFVYWKGRGALPDRVDWQFQLMSADKPGLTGSGITLFVDSWGHSIRYLVPGQRSGLEFDLYSIGVNGIDEGGTGDDLGNWDGSWPPLDGVWRHIRDEYAKQGR